MEHATKALALGIAAFLGMMMLQSVGSKDKPTQAAEVIIAIVVGVLVALGVWL